MIGILLIALPAVYLFQGYIRENQVAGEWQQVVASLPHHQDPGATTDPATGKPKQPSASGQLFPDLLFAIRVPKIGYYAAVRQGVTADILYFGPGHYTSTPMPGSVGNVGVAAHNTYWIQFGQLKPGDTVILEARYGTYTYKITGSKIVLPTDRTVLAQNTKDKHLTLTTCWPLWAGAFATRRLVFFAEQVSAQAR